MPEKSEEKREAKWEKSAKREREREEREDGSPLSSAAVKQEIVYVCTAESKVIDIFLVRDNDGITF